MENPAFDPDVEAFSSGGHIYDVTLSWNSDGTKQPFFSTLYEALVRSGLHTFNDDGVSKSDVQKAREQSLISIIILSEDLTESGQELETIVERSSRFNYLVVPVFYDVNPYGRLDHNNEAGIGSSKQRLGPGISDLMALVLPKDTVNEPKAIQSFVGFIQDGIKTNQISSWASKVCQLKDSGLSKLPNNLKFPLLKELFLQDNKYLLTIPNSFFEFMPTLQVLDLSRTSIKHLPPSISNLVCLQKLFLRECALLRKLPPEIQDLKNLEIFDLSGTELIYIPKEIKELYKLECLRMSLSAHADEYLSGINEDLEVDEKIEIIPGYTLSKLSNLKELSIFVDLNCKWWGVLVESIILELGSLNRLKMLTLYFPTVHLLQRLLQLQNVCQNLSNFRLVVGRGDQRVISRYIPQELQDEFETLEKCLKYVNGREDINEVAKACKYARTLFVDRHWTIETLSVLKNSVENIMFCVLIECNLLKSVINGHDIRPEDDNEDEFDVEKPILGLLQYLSIHYMKNLKTICAGPFPSGSLKKLQILALNACSNLDVILDVELLRNLVSLKELIVEDCPKVESLVSVESSYLESDVEFLPCLERITLLYLPELASISGGVRIAPKLAIMVVYHCPKLKTLYPMKIYGKHLKEIKGESEWWNALEGERDQLGIFVPLEGDGLMSQLAEARTSYNTLSTIRDSDLNQEPEKESEVKETWELVIAKEDATTTSEKASQVENLAGKNPKGQILNSGESYDVPDGFCRDISIDEILAATHNFSHSFVIGVGEFATVYKGEIDHGTRTVAIKKLNLPSPQFRKMLNDEVLMVSRVRHSNLVSLIGYCETDDKVILVYEHMDGGTLYDNLHNKHRVPLCWVERLKICIGVARALDYLHTGFKDKVIHGNIKSSNILLDQNWTTAKISNFGLSKIGPANQADTGVMTAVLPTFGYMDPEFIETSLFTTKSDVYAYGVVLFELLSGRQAVGTTLDDDQRSLARWAQLCVIKGKFEQIIDPNLKSEMMPRSLAAFVKIAYRCLNGRQKERPTMTEVLTELVLALSLQETEKQDGSKTSRMLQVFTSAKPWPISEAAVIDAEVKPKTGLLKTLHGPIDWLNNMAQQPMLLDANSEARTSNDTLSMIRNSDANQEPEKELEEKRTRELEIAKAGATTTSEKASQIEELAKENTKGLDDQKSSKAPLLDTKQSRDAAHLNNRFSLLPPKYLTDRKRSSFQKNILHPQLSSLLPNSAQTITEVDMAESFAFQIAGQILGKLSALAIRGIGLIWGVKSNLKKLERTVISIKSVLPDAAKQKKRSQQVVDWLEKLHDVLEDATDLLDDFMTEELRHQVVIKESKRKAVINFFSSSNSLVPRTEMSQRLQKILSDLEDIDADRKRFQFAEYVLDYPVTNRESREQTHSFIRASEVFGRSSDKERIIKLLLSTPSSTGSSMTIDENTHILPIVGLGGLGKTTLAKLVYNDDGVSSSFELKLWICVSEEFDVKNLIEKIMEDATGGDDHSHLALNQLQVRLQTTLKSKKFLLVLDDVWTEDVMSCIELKELLRCGAKGSKVIVTTRNRTTAEIMGTFPIYELKGLSDHQCLSIFIRCAFKEGEAEKYLNLLEIGKAMVKRCNGLPLAVKSLGGLLFTKRDKREWVRIRDRGIWEISQKENDILPILKLSYDDMPPHLKQCFAYCAVFPKDLQLSRLGIVTEWMAHGLLNSHDESLFLEDNGDCYLHELISRSFFQDVTHLYDGLIYSFKMHDLVHEFALSVASKTISHIRLDSAKDISEKTRHLLICDPSMEGKEFPFFLLKLGKLRTLRFMFAPRSISNRFLDTLIKTFTCLRALHLGGSEIEELPNSIGMLKNLRFLDLFGNVNIKRLPNDICNLINLQTLYLHGCIMLQDLPREFGNLRSLRVLYLSGQMKCFPMKGVEGLSSLQELYLTRCVHLESLLEGIKSPVSLRILNIHECPNLTSLPTQSTRYLTSLEHLYITNCEKFNFSDEDSKMMELPRGFLSLTLEKLPKLKELPSGFEGASPSIKCIAIYNCNSFAILPEWLKKCTSLSKLKLAGCVENLNEDCQRETGKYFPFICHIPQIDFA